MLVSSSSCSTCRAAAGGSACALTRSPWAFVTLLTSVALTRLRSYTPVPEGLPLSSGGAVLIVRQVSLDYTTADIAARGTAAALAKGQSSSLEVCKDVTCTL